MILTNKMMGRREQHHNASRTKVRMESKERRGKQHLLPQMSLKSIFRRRVERSCSKTNNEKSKLVVGLWKTSQELEVKPATNENNCLLEINEEMKTSFNERIGGNLDYR